MTQPQITECEKDDVLSSRKYARMLKAKKTWRCARCVRKITPGEDYEHSYTANRGYDLRLCFVCSSAI